MQYTKRKALKNEKTIRRKAKYRGEVVKIKKKQILTIKNTKNNIILSKSKFFKNKLLVIKK
jgi:hypothetical protein